MLHAGAGRARHAARAAPDCKDLAPTSSHAAQSDASHYDPGEHAAGYCERPAAAEVFFELDPSSRQPLAPDSTISYDDWSEQTERNRIEPYDVTVLNTSMRARTQPEVWQPLQDAGDLGWLEAVDPGWDLLSMPQDEFNRRDIGAVVEQLAFSLLRKWINVSVATKMLHLKRPRLMPVLDPLVVAQLEVRVSTTAKFETRARQIRDVAVFFRERGARTSIG